MYEFLKNIKDQNARLTLRYNSGNKRTIHESTPQVCMVLKLWG